MAVRALAARDLTEGFRRARVRHIEQCGGASSRKHMLADVQDDDLEACYRMLKGDIEMQKLPSPLDWLECSRSAQEDLQAIHRALTVLSKAQKSRLLKVFEDDTVPNREVEVSATQVTHLLRRCEKSIHAVTCDSAIVKSDNATVDCHRVSIIRSNMRQHLAGQLQLQWQHFKRLQKGYLTEIARRESSHTFNELETATSLLPDQAGGFSDAQLLEVGNMEASAASRSQEICRIASSVSDLNTIFKELAGLVIDQGSILDRIDYNIEEVAKISQDANVQLRIAEKSMEKNNGMRCILILVAINVVLLVMLVMKNRLR